MRACFLLCQHPGLRALVIVNRSQKMAHTAPGAHSNFSGQYDSSFRSDAYDLLVPLSGTSTRAHQGAAWVVRYAIRLTPGARKVTHLIPASSLRKLVP